MGRTQYRGGKVSVKEFWLKKRDRLLTLRSPVFADIKYDGEYCMAETFLSSQSMLINGYGRSRVGSPILDELPSESVLFGELYSDEGKNGDLYKLLSNKLGDDLRFAVFDAYCLEGRDISTLSLMERKELLTEWFIGHTPSNLTHIVDTYYCELPNEIDEAFDEAVLRGYEGVVVKECNYPLLFGSQCRWVKLKYTTTADLKVAYIDPNKERIECEIPGRHQRLGVKVMNKDRIKLNVGDMVEIEHYGVLSGGGLRHPVYKRKREAGKRVSVDV